MKTLHETKRLLILEHDGWEYVERKKAKSAVAIIAVTDANELVLTEQHRKPVNARVIDLPAGLIGDEDANLDAVATARKELKEETGFTCERIDVLTEGASSPGITSERVVVVRAHGLTRSGEGGGVGGEKITVHLVPLANAASWLRERTELIDLKVWSALYFVTQST